MNIKLLIEDTSIAMSIMGTTAVVRPNPLPEQLGTKSPAGSFDIARKYEAAVDLYTNSELSIREIAEQTGVTPIALSSYLSRHHRDLLYKRYGITIPEGKERIAIKSPKGQSYATHRKYKDAIAACDDIAYIEFNVSQIARMFGLSGTGLAAQLRVHYPSVIPKREATRNRLGLADRQKRGARQTSQTAYSQAVDLYKDSDLTIEEVAQRFGISPSGFGQHMRFYHHDAIRRKAKRRKDAKKPLYKRTSGSLAGNGQLYGPREGTEIRYARALELYQEGRKTLAEIVKETGVSLSGLKYYLNQWCREKRQGRKEAKYGDAIESLRSKPRAVAEVAKEFGLNPEVFRQYLRKHVPELADGQGMIRLENGKLVKKTAWEKYRSAIEQYKNNGGTIREIALSHGLKYPSLLSFIRRMEAENN